MKLHDLQRTFAEALVVPKSLADDAEWRARGETAFTGNARVTPIGQLDIYREQFWIRHVNCLREDFPVLLALVGDEKLEAIVAEYLAAHPPKKFQLRHLGESLADFLATRDDALLADLARVEWAFIDAFDAPDAPPLDPTVIAAIAEDDWPNARLVLHPSLQLLRLAHPTNAMRDAWWADKDKRPIERVPREATNVIVYRHKQLLYTEVMDALPFEMLTLLASGKSLGTAGDELAASTNRSEEIESSIGEWFTRWSALGWISRVLV
ncbi:MAG TPA: DNA-binding domain-containing protein [Polyangiaceae bacterium]|jgi:hypothetical protein